MCVFVCLCPQVVKSGKRGYWEQGIWDKYDFVKAGYRGILGMWDLGKGVFWEYGILEAWDFGSV